MVFDIYTHVQKIPENFAVKLSFSLLGLVYDCILRSSSLIQEPDYTFTCWKLSSRTKRWRNYTEISREWIFFIKGWWLDICFIISVNYFDFHHH